MSTKIKSSLEALTGIILIFGYVWLIIPLNSQWIEALSAVPIVLFIIYCDFINKKSFKQNLDDIGFRWDNWRGSFKILFVFTLVTMPVLYAVWHNYFPVRHNFYNGFSSWINLFTKILQALIQQYVFLGFFFRRYKNIFSPHINIAIFFSALTFAAIHIPTPPLIIFCFVAGIVWAATYNKYPNLFTIAISHAVLGIFCSSVLLVYIKVGPNADFGRWHRHSDFGKWHIKNEQPSVNCSIDYVNNIRTYKNINKETKALDVNMNNEKKSISVKGWVASTDKIKNIQLSFGGNDYSVHYGGKREDVAAYYDNPGFLNSGFSADIPVLDLAPGKYKMFLKVYLEGERYSSHYPCSSILVNLK